MQLKCKGYHYLINGQNIWLEDKLDVNKFISKEEFDLASTPDENDNEYDKLVHKLAVHMGTRNKITGKFVDLYFFKKLVIGLIVIIFLSSCSGYEYLTRTGGCSQRMSKKFDASAKRAIRTTRFRSNNYPRY